MKIFINPSHGGSDPGACGNGLRESDVALAIGKRVEGYLRAVGYDVKFFQCGELDEICFDANAWKADLFVSIHCNAATGTAKGTEIHCSTRATKAQDLQRTFKLNLSIRCQLSIASLICAASCVAQIKVPLKVASRLDLSRLRSCKSIDTKGKLVIKLPRSKARKCLLTC